MAGRPVVGNGRATAKVAANWPARTAKEEEEQDKGAEDDSRPFYNSEWRFRQLARTKQPDRPKQSSCCVA